MKHLLLTFDVEEFVFPKENGLPFKDAFSVSFEGLKEILDLLEKRSARSTFFTTYEFAEKFPHIIAKIVRDGHELAFHGKVHKEYIDATDKTVEEFRECRSYLEKIFRTKVTGFRAPRFFPVSHNILEESGFLYDSSYHPTIIPPNRNTFTKRGTWKNGKIIEICPSVTSIRLPVSWFFFRLLPLGYSISCTKNILRHSDYIMLYFHPWDFYELENIGFKGIYWNLYKKNSGKKLAGKLNSYLDFTYRTGLKNTTVKDYLKTKTI